MYTFDLPAGLDASSPTYVIEGHPGEGKLELTFDSYEHAVAELSFTVTVTHEGMTSSRVFGVRCGPGYGDLGTIVGERVSLSSFIDPRQLAIDSIYCDGTRTSIAIVDCGC